MNKGLTAEQANAYLKLADQKRAEAVEKLTKPALEEINKMGLKAEADKYTPALQASLTPDEINKAQELKGIERIYLAPIFEPTLDVARDVVEADVYWPGWDGSGVKVAEIEVGGKINTSNPNLSGVTQDTTSSCQDDHAAAVAGIIHSTDTTAHGIVSAASLWIGGSCGGNADQLEEPHQRRRRLGGERSTTAGATLPAPACARSISSSTIWLRIGSPQRRVCRWQPRVRLLLQPLRDQPGARLQRHRRRGLG